MKRILGSLLFAGATVFILFTGDSFADTEAAHAGGKENLLFMSPPQVVTPSKNEEPILTAPGTVYVVTENEIKRYGFRNLRDILKSIPNNDMSDNLAYAQYGQRGFYSNGSNTLLLVDGREMNVMTSETVFINDCYLVQNIKRVEVIMGPNSALYGSKALDGVINIVTKSGADLTGDVDLTEASITEGQANTSAYQGVYRVNRADYSIGGSFSYCTSKNNYKALGEFAVDQDRYSRSAYNQFRYTDPDQFRMDQEYVNTDLFMRYKEVYAGAVMNKALNYSGIEYALYGPQDNGQNRNDNHTFIGVKHDFSDDIATKLEYQYSISENRFNVVDLTPANLATATSFDDLQRQERSTPREIKKEELSGTLGYKTMANNSFLAGFDWWDRLKDRNAQTNGVIIADEGDFTYADTGSALNVYIQDTYSFTEALRLVGGVLYYQEPNVKSKFTPRASFIYQPTKDSALEIAYGQGFRGPNTGEISRNRAAGFNGLRPQGMDMIEASYNQKADLEESLGLFNELSVYKMRLTDRIVTTTGVIPSTGLIGQMTANGGTQNAWGLEDLLKISSGKFAGFFGGRYVDADKVRVGSYDVNYVPKTKLTSGLSYDVFKKIEASLSMNYCGKVETVVNSKQSSYSGTIPTELYEIKPYTILNFHLDLGEFETENANLLISLYAENILNKKYYQPNWAATNPVQYMQYPRNYRIKVSMKL